MSPTFWLLFNATFAVFNAALAATAASTYLMLVHVGFGMLSSALVPHWWRQRLLEQEAREIAALNALLSDTLSQLNLRASILFANAKRRENARWRN